MKVKDSVFTVILTVASVIVGLFLGMKMTKNIHDANFLLTGLEIGFIVPILYWTVLKKVR